MDVPVPGPRLHTVGCAATSPAEADRLVASIYPTLRGLARSYLRRERADHTLQPTALVHEAYLRLVDSGNFEWQSRSHLIGAAARAMRQVLIRHAKRQLALKRGGGCMTQSLDERVTSAPAMNPDLIVLDEALDRLFAFDARASQVVELRFFAGLTTKETAAVLGISEITARRDWIAARSWLNRFVTRG